MSNDAPVPVLVDCPDGHSNAIAYFERGAAATGTFRNNQASCHACGVTFAVPDGEYSLDAFGTVQRKPLA